MIGTLKVWTSQIETLINTDDETTFYKDNSGLWTISRLPIILENQISFSQFREWDKLASKGAKLYSVKKDERKLE